MKGKTLAAVIVIIVVLIALILIGIFFFNGGEKRAEEKGKETNSIFHTVQEGGTCRDGQGDCQGGLTCANGVCQKP